MFLWERPKVVLYKRLSLSLQNIKNHKTCQDYSSILKTTHVSRDEHVIIKNTFIYIYIDIFLKGRGSDKCFFQIVPPHLIYGDIILFLITISYMKLYDFGRSYFETFCVWKKISKRTSCLVSANRFSIVFHINI